MPRGAIFEGQINDTLCLSLGGCECCCQPNPNAKPVPATSYLLLPRVGEQKHPTGASGRPVPQGPPSHPCTPACPGTGWWGCCTSSRAADAVGGINTPISKIESKKRQSNNSKIVGQCWRRRRMNKICKRIIRKLKVSVAGAKKKYVKHGDTERSAIQHSQTQCEAEASPSSTRGQWGRMLRSHVQRSRWVEGGDRAGCRSGRGPRRPPVGCRAPPRGGSRGDGRGRPSRPWGQPPGLGGGGRDPEEGRIGSNVEIMRMGVRMLVWCRGDGRVG